MNAVFDQRRQRVEQQINIAFGHAASPPVRDAAYDFDELIDSTTRWFVGRERLLEAIRDFEARYPCGYFRVIADAGLGKTALAAEVARRFQASAFFASASRGLTRPDQCLKHLCAELITRYDLRHDYLPTRAGEDSAFLSQLLDEAAGRMHPIWLVVDALDEADQAVPGRNPLLLPARLPPGVYALITQRPGQLAFHTDPHTPFVERVILSNSPEQLTDIELYLHHQVAQNPGIAAALAGARPRVEAESFVRRMAAASQGNFMFLDYQLRQVEVGVGELDLSLDALPRGLSGYYGGFWSTIEATRDQAGWSDWKRLYRPVIERLAVAREPVSAAWLADQTSTDPDEIRERVLRPWRRLLSSEQSPSGETWRTVHRSFGDFLAERVDRVGAHRAVGLRDLHEPSRWRTHAGYTRRHLAAHLRLGGEREALFGLLDDRVWYEAQMAADPSGSAYLHDLSQAWLAAEELDEHATGGEQAAELLGRQIRCALASASVLSQSSNIPHQLLAGLLDAKQLTIDNALNVAYQNPDPRLRCEALVALAARCDAVRHADVMLAALAAARSIDDVGDRALALAQATPLLPQPERVGVAGQALELLHDVRDTRQQARVLAVLVPHLESSALQAALVTTLVQTRGLASAKQQVRVLETLAPALPASCVGEVWSIARSLRRASWQARALAILAPVLPDAILGDALDLAAGLNPPAARAQAFVGLAPRFPADKRTTLLEESLRGIRTIDDPARRAHGLATVAPSMPASQRDEVLGEALVAVRAIPTAPARIQAFLTLISHLPDAQRPVALGEALATIRDIAEAKTRVEALTSLALHVAASDRDAILEEALAGVAALRASDWHARGKALARLGPLLPQHLLDQALATARAIGDEASQARTLAMLCAGLDEPESHRVVEATLAIVGRLASGRDRARALAALAPQLTEPARSAAVEAALADAALIQGAEDKALVIAALAPHCSERLLASALHIARAIENGGWQTRALVALAPQLPAHLLNQALEIAEQLERTGLRVRALAALAQCFPDPQQGDLLFQARAVLGTIDGVEQRLRALTALVPFLSADEQTQCVREALEILPDVGQRARGRAIATLTPYLSDADRLKWVSRALDEALAHDCGDREVRVLLVLASRVPDTRRDEVLDQLTPWMLDISEERGEALAALADCAAGLPTRRRSQLWRAALHSCATRGRQELIDDLPALVRLCEPPASREAVGAIQATLKWWP